MKQLILCSWLFCTASAFCMDKVIDSMQSKQEQFLQMAKDGNASGIASMLEVDYHPPFPIRQILTAKTEKEGRSVLHVAALRYITHNNADAFDVFRVCFEAFKKANIDINDIRDFSGKNAAEGRNVRESILGRIEASQNPTPGAVARASLILDVLDGRISSKDQVVHTLDTLTPDEIFFNNVRKGDLPAVIKFLGMKQNSAEYLNATRDAREQRPALHRATMGYLFDKKELVREKCLSTILYLLLQGADPRIKELRHERDIISFIENKKSKHKDKPSLKALEERATNLSSIILSVKKV